MRYKRQKLVDRGSFRAMTGGEEDAWANGVVLDPDNIERDAHKIIQVVRPHWRREEVRFQRCTQSFVNRVVKAYCKDVDDALIFRVYPRGQFDSPMDKYKEKQITRLLNDLQICPKVNCVFKNGVCFDHVTGDILNWTDFSPLDDVNIAKCSVRELARFHCTRTRDLAISKYGIKEENVVPGVFEMILKMVHNVYPQKLPASNNQVLDRIPSLETLRSDFDAARLMVEDLNLPLVLCHNDPNPTNIIYNKRTDKSTIVDYDVTGFGYAAYDLAYFLVTLGIGSNLASSDSPRRQPSYWKDVIREYLNTKHELEADDDDVTERDVETLYVQVRTASLCAILSFVLFYLIDSTLPKAPYGSPSIFLKLAGDLYTDRFLKEREEVLQLKVPT